MPTLIYNPDLERFEFLTSGPQDRHPAKSAGFRFDAKLKDRWWTDQPHKAAKLINFADGFARKLLAEADQEARSSIEASRATEADIEIPVNDGLEYMGFQKAGIQFACTRPSAIRGTLVADEMGLGKTIQALGYINAKPEVKRVLIIVPATLKLNWRREFKKWITRPMTVAVVDSKKKTWPGHADVVVINYDILVKSQAKIESLEWDLIICDEAHYVKNKNAQRTQIVVGNKRPKGKQKKYDGLRTKQWLMLTGTPIVNRPKELWNILKLLDPTRWTNFMAYAKRYCDASHNGFGWDFNGASNLEELHQILRSTIMVRRLKSEVLKELPPKQHQVIEIPCNGLSRTVTQEAHSSEKLEQMKDELDARTLEAELTDDLPGFTREIRKLEVEVEAEFTELSRLRHETAIAKVKLLKSYLTAMLEEDQKIVLFAHHHDVIDFVMDLFGDAAVKLDGRMSDEEKDESVQRFQNDPKVKIFMGQILAAGVGITLTASSNVRFLEFDWTPGNMQQAADRLHRIGQAECVNVQYFVLEGSTDAKMAHTIADKSENIYTALDGGTQEDWLHQDVISESVVADMKEESKRVQDQWEARQAQLRKEADEIGLNPERITAIHQGLKMLAGMCDGAVAQDDRGFSSADVDFGHDLAGRNSITPRQAVIGLKFVNKYRRQLPLDVLEIAGINEEYLETMRKKAGA